MGSLNLTELHDLVTICLQLAGDDSLSQDQQDTFLRLGQHFHNDEAVALQKTWDSEDDTLKQLNAEMDKIIQAIKDEQATEDSFAAVVNKMTQVLNVLDKILVAKA